MTEVIRLVNPLISLQAKKCRTLVDAAYSTTICCGWVQLRLAAIDIHQLGEHLQGLTAFALEGITAND